MIKKITNLLKGDSLKSRFTRSTIVLGSGAFIAKILGFGSKVLLAKLLVPEEIGLMIVIISLTQLFEIFTEVGIKQAVIQNENGAEIEFINMAWWFQAVRTACLYLIGFALTPLLCEFYFRSKPEVLACHSMGELITLIRISFLCILFNGLISPAAYVLEKQFRFFKAMIIMQGGFLIGTIITIVLALIYRSVWAMVIGFVCISFSRFLLSYILCPLQPRFSFCRDSFRELLRFSKGVIGLPLFTYAAFNIDILVAGKLLSADIIGFYGMAIILAVAPFDLFNKIISPVLLPVFSEKQNDHESICKFILKMSTNIIIICIPWTVLVFMCGSTILSYVFNEDYSKVAFAFSFLCVYCLLLILGSILGNVFFGIGQPGKHRLFVVVRVLVLAIFIYPATKLFGVSGAALVLVVASTLAICVQLFMLHKIIGLKSLGFFTAWPKGFVLAIPVIVTVLLAQTVIPERYLLHLFVGISCCIVISLIGIILTNKRQILRLKKTVS